MKGQLVHLLVLAAIMAAFGLVAVLLERCIDAYADRYSSIYVGAIGACLAGLAALIVMERVLP